MGSLEKFRRMATVIQDSNDAITFQDLDGNILAWNQGAEIMYGYSEADALNMNIVDTVPKEYQEEARQFLSSLKRGELVPTLETKRKTKDGRIVDVWLTNTKLTDDKGNLTGIATTERDITERKHSEASFREKARELEFLREGQITLSDKMRGEQNISRLGQSVLSHLAPFLNAQMGAFYYVTEEKTLKRVSGYASSKLENKEKTIAFGEGLVGQAALQSCPIILEQVPAQYFGKIGSDLGESVPRSLLLAPVYYEGEVNGVIELASFSSFSEHQKTFLEHVSENIGIAINTSMSRKKLEELLNISQSLTEELQTQQGELKASNDELEQQRDILNENNEALGNAQTLLEERSSEVQRASQYKSEFLANMSHELRTPLNSTLILAKLLADNAGGNLTQEQIQYAQSISSAGNDLLNLINDILDLSKVEAGKLGIRPESVFLPTVFNIIEKTFDSLAKEKKLQFKIKIDPDVPERMLTDRQRLEQILKNLLSNAFKFTEKGQVTLKVFRSSGERLSFAVIDTGVGVPQEQQEVIFEAFRQADGTTNRKYGGTGLGLSISRDLARLLGGSVEVESISGEGSCFTLLLPMTYDESLIAVADLKAYSSPIAVVDVDSPTAPVALRPERIKRVLIIEDDKIQRESIVNLIAGADIEITAVALAKEALSALKKTVYDCLVLDLKLTDMSGEEFLKKMTAQDDLIPFPPTIIYTGRSLSRDEENRLRKYSCSIIIKGTMSSERLFDEVNFFLHINQFKESPKRRPMLKILQNCEDVFKGYKILVVDDDVRNIFALTAALEQKGASIEVARNGKEALAKLKDNPRLDLVLMDIMMPVMDGYQATREIRKQKRFAKLPIIAVTAKATKNDQVLCMEAGANDYLAKPIDLDQLFSVIRVWAPRLERD
ncbi:MAG: hypothetical protein ACD_62C00124G0009 [uncultured bacterium]|nr:MAG: hypothetical protein ACD_62C00124G0009 [uncultured bacterium]